MKRTSPTQRTLAKLRADGWTCQVVEHWNPFSRTRLDLFGVIDIVAVRPGAILGVQCTSMDNLSKRIAKAKAEPRLQAWLEAGGLFECHGWRKLTRGQKRPTWQAHVERIGV